MLIKRYFLKITVFMLIAVLMFSFVPFSFAAQSVAAGQQVEITVRFINKVSASPTIYIAYDTSAFTMDDDSFQWLVQTGTQPSSIVYSTSADGSERKDIDLSVTNLTDFSGRTGSQIKVTGSSSSADTNVDVFKCSVTALKNTTIDDSSFYAGTASIGGVTRTISNYEVVGSGGSTDTPVYTAAASTEAAGLTVGNTFNVAVTLTATAGAEYAQAQVDLTYDAEKVKPNLEGLDVNVSGAGGTLTITKPANLGQNTAVGEGLSLATIPFEAILAGDAKFSVSEGAEISFVTKEGNDTFAIKAGDDLTVNIAPGAAVITFESAYKGLPGGFQLLLREIDDADKVWTYGGAPMHNITKGGKTYATYIVDSGVTADTAAVIAKTDADYDVTANINGDGAINISDSQIAFDLANGYEGYADGGALSIAIRLAADVDGNGQVEVADAHAINYAIHHGGSLGSL
jgi:hypothetical protein